MDLYDVVQNRRVNEAKSAAERSAGQSANTAENVRSLERRVRELTAITEALWLLLREAGQMTEEHLESRLSEVRKRVAETRGTAVCPQCNRTGTLKHPNCLYCGAPLPRQSASISV